MNQMSFSGIDQITAFGFFNVNLNHVMSVSTFWQCSFSYYNQVYISCLNYRSLETQYGWPFILDFLVLYYVSVWLTYTYTDTENLDVAESKIVLYTFFYYRFLH